MRMCGILSILLTTIIPAHLQNHPGITVTVLAILIVAGLELGWVLTAGCPVTDLTVSIHIVLSMFIAWGILPFRVVGCVLGIAIRIAIRIVTIRFAI